MRRLFVLILALGAGACVGHDSSSVTGTTPVTAQARQSGLLPLGSSGNTLLSCPADSVAVTVRQTVGVLGGTIQFGPNTLVVPPGAVLTPTTITATTPADGHLTAEFQPEGLRFLVPPTLILGYAQCSPPPTGTLTIAYLDGPLGQILQLLQTVTDPVTQTMSAPIMHFSVYAAAESRR
jgi:hypothetical protein